MQRVRSFKTRAQAWLTASVDETTGDTDDVGAGGGSAQPVAPPATGTAPARQRRRLPSIPPPGDTDDPLLRRVEDMIERCEFAAAVQVLDRLPDADFASRCLQLPYKKLCRAFLPDSLRLLETLLVRIDKLSTRPDGDPTTEPEHSEPKPAGESRVEFPTRVCEDLSVQLGLFFAAVEGTPSSFQSELQSARRVLALAMRHSPAMFDDLAARRAQMCTALETLRQREEAAPSAHSSVRDAVMKASRQLKSTLEKLDSQAPANAAQTRHDPDRVSLDLGVLQERLFARQTVLNSVKIDQLTSLMKRLSTDAGAEKDVLTVVNQIKRDLPPGVVAADQPLEPIIEKHLHAFELLLGVLEDSVEGRAHLELRGENSIASQASVSQEHAPVMDREEMRARSKSVGVAPTRRQQVGGEQFSNRFRVDLFTSLVHHSRVPGHEAVSSAASSAQNSPSETERERPSSRPSSGRVRTHTGTEDRMDAVKTELEKTKKELLKACETINHLKKREKDLTDR